MTEQLTPEQEHLREVTAKWLHDFNTHTDDDAKEWDKLTQSEKEGYFEWVADLEKVQQAAGAVLKDSDQDSQVSKTHESCLYCQGYKDAVLDLTDRKFVKVQPLTGGKS